MKRSILLLTAGVAAVFAMTGCGGDKKNRETAQSTGETIVEETKAKEVVEVWEGEYQCKNGDNECRDDRLFGGNHYFIGTVFNTIVDKDVNVRGHPSASGNNPLFQLKADTRIQILGITKDWVYITTRETVPRRGWASASLVNYKEEDQRPEPITLDIVSFNLTARDSSTAELTASYTIDNAKKTVHLQAFKAAGQNFFTFFFDTYVENFHYRIRPGLYTWQPVNNRLDHRVFLTRAPYAAEEEGSAIWEWAAFTDDFKYYFIRENDASAPQAFRASDRGRILADTEIGILSLRNKTVRAACTADELAADKEEAEAEKIRYEFAHFVSQGNDSRPENADESYMLHVLCEVNLETGVRKITGTEWRAVR